MFLDETAVTPTRSGDRAMRRATRVTASLCLTRLQDHRGLGGPASEYSLRHRPCEQGDRRHSTPGLCGRRTRVGAHAQRHGRRGQPERPQGERHPPAHLSNRCLPPPAFDLQPRLQSDPKCLRQAESPDADGGSPNRPGPARCHSTCLHALHIGRMSGLSRRLRLRRSRPSLNGNSSFLITPLPQPTVFTFTGISDWLADNHGWDPKNGIGARNSALHTSGNA